VSFRDFRRSAICFCGAKEVRTAAQTWADGIGERREERGERREERGERRGERERRGGNAIPRIPSAYPPQSQSATGNLASALLTE
jgi:hypothetical protein